MDQPTTPIEKCLDCGSLLIHARERCCKCYKRDWWKRKCASKEKRPRCVASGCGRYAVIEDKCRQCNGRGRVQVKAKGVLRSDITSLDNRIEEAQYLYNLTVGLASRMRRRTKITELNAQKRLLEERLNA